MEDEEDLNFTISNDINKRISIDLGVEDSEAEDLADSRSEPEISDLEGEIHRTNTTTSSSTAVTISSTNFNTLNVLDQVQKIINFIALHKIRPTSKNTCSCLINAAPRDEQLSGIYQSVIEVIRSCRKYMEVHADNESDDSNHETLIRRMMEGNRILFQSNITHRLFI